MLKIKLKLVYVIEDDPIAAATAKVLLGRRSWVGLRYTPEAAGPPAVLSPADAAGPALPPTDAATRRRLEFLYAKDYAYDMDLRTLWRGWRGLGSR